MRRVGVLVASCVALLGTSAAHAQKRTYINPIDVDYRYNWEQTNTGISYRTGADPVIVRHKDAYYLFQTLADGYWRSTNLIDWTFITPSMLAIRRRRCAGRDFRWRPADPLAVDVLHPTRLDPGFDRAGNGQARLPRPVDAAAAQCGGRQISREDEAERDPAGTVGSGPAQGR